MGSRKERAQIASETVEILRRGWYETPRGKQVDISAAQRQAEAASRHYQPEDFAEVFRERDRRIAKPAATPTRFHVVNCTTFTAARDLLAADATARVFCLDFASAKHPGGGFLSGAQAQEECLARASGLYGCLQRHPQMYDANLRQRTSLYSDHMIYSPGVPVFRDDDDVLLDEPYCLTFLTSPAVNLGAVRDNEPHNVSRAASVMLARIEKLLSLAVAHGDRQLVLGAWGCGVFRNDPAHVAQWFQHWLVERPVFRGAFDVVVFAVLDRSDDLATFLPFQRQFAA
jgi:uncharacterized protein (TIGR02452 family)